MVKSSGPVYELVDVGVYQRSKRFLTIQVCFAKLPPVLRTSFTSSIIVFIFIQSNGKEKTRAAQLSSLFDYEEHLLTSEQPSEESSGDCIK